MTTLLPVKIGIGMFATERLVTLPDKSRIYVDERHLLEKDGRDWLICEVVDERVILLPNGNGAWAREKI